MGRSPTQFISSTHAVARNSALLFCALSVFAPGVAGAQGLQNPINQASLYCFLVSILEMLVLILFPIVVLVAVYGGYLFVAAQGNPAKIQEARRYVIWVFVGALIMLGAKVLAFAVESTVENIYVDSGLGGSLTTGRSTCP